MKKKEKITLGELKKSFKKMKLKVKISGGVPKTRLMHDSDLVEIEHWYDISTKKHIVRGIVGNELLWEKEGKWDIHINKKRDKIKMVLERFEMTYAEARIYFDKLKHE